MFRSILIPLVLLCFWSQAQNAEIDSLHAIIGSNAPDTVKVKAYWLIGFEMVHYDPQKAILYADTAVRLAQKADWAYGHGRAIYSLALAYDFAGESQNSVDAFARAKVIFEELDNQEWVGNCINSTGVTYYYAGELNKALEKYLEALNHWERHDDKVHASQTLNNIGVIYRFQMKHEQAIAIYEKSVALKQELGDKRGLAFTYRNLGVAHSYLGNEETAIDYGHQAIELLEELEEYRELSAAHGSLGTSHMKLKQYAKAEESMTHALDLAEEAVDAMELRTMYATMAAIKNKLNKYQEAVQYGDLALATLKENPDPSVIRDALMERSCALLELGRYEEAAHGYKDTFEQTLIISDSTRLKEMEAMQAQFDVKQREQELAISELELAEQERQNTVFIWGLAGAGLLLVLAIILIIVAIISARRKVKNNKRLREKNQIIEKSLEEKEVLLREIHHRVKNNLQVISSLLSIQSREIEDAAALEAVNESRNRVKSMAIIHQNLYQEDNLTGIDVGDYVEKLSQSLFSSYRIDRDTIELKTDIDHLNLDVDTTIPLGLILNELITNALKYAFVSREQGLLTVKLKEHKDFLELTVADNGIGMTNVKETLGESFGMKMIDAFAKKLEAEWEVEEDNGTTVSIRIRKYQKAS